MEAEAVRLAAHPALSEAPAASPIWAGAFLEPDRAGLPDAVRAALTTLGAALARVAHGAASLAPLCGLPVPDTLSGADQLLSAAALFAAAPAGLPAAWLDGGEGPDGLRPVAARLAARFSALRDEREALLRAYDPEILTLPHGPLLERLTDRFEEALRPLLGGSWRDRAVRSARTCATASARWRRSRGTCTRS
jgi:hypothetical protein